MATTHEHSGAGGNSSILELGVAVLSLVEVELLLSGESVSDLLVFWNCN